jgi:hypothetical protein
MSSVIESFVAKGDTESAIRQLEGLHGLLCNRFRNQERSMAGLAGLSGHDAELHRREHEALLSGLGALHRAIVAADLARLRAQVSAYVNRVIRHVVDHDVTVSEQLAAA